MESQPANRDGHRGRTVVPSSEGPMAKRRAQLAARRASAAAEGEAPPCAGRPTTDVVAAPEMSTKLGPDWLDEPTAPQEAVAVEPSGTGQREEPTGQQQPADAAEKSSEPSSGAPMGLMAKRRAQQARKRAQEDASGGADPAHRAAQPAATTSSDGQTVKLNGSSFKVEVGATQEATLKANFASLVLNSKVVWNGEVIDSELRPLQLRRISEAPAATFRAGANTQGNQLAALLMQTKAKGQSASFTLGSITQTATTSTSPALHMREQAATWRKATQSRTSQLLLPPTNTKSLRKITSKMENCKRPDPQQTLASRTLSKGKIIVANLSNKAVRKIKGGNSDVGKTPPVIQESGESSTATVKAVDNWTTHTDVLTLERYKFPVNIYEGAMSTVFVAIDTVEKDPVVLRRYSIADLAIDQSIMLGKEIQLLEKMPEAGNHGVVDYRGTFKTDEHIYVVTENCTEGDLLRDLTLSRGQSLPEERVRDVIIPQLLTTLKYLHKRRVVHCDIKPENLFQTSKGKIKLGDFHLAVDMNQEVGVHRRGMVDYMPPEMLVLPVEGEELVVSGRKRLISSFNEKVDIWQVGILAYELLTGSTPFEAKEVNLTAAMILWGDMESFPLYMSENAVDFISKCLAKNPRKRPDAVSLLKHPWVFKSMLQTFSGADRQDVDHPAAEAEQRENGLRWVLPGFAELKYNVAEMFSRDGGMKDTEAHEYIAGRDDGFLLRMFKSISSLLGLDKEASEQEQRERSSFEHVGETALSENQLVGRLASSVVDDIVSARNSRMSQRQLLCTPEYQQQASPKQAGAAPSVAFSHAVTEVIEEGDGVEA